MTARGLPVWVLATITAVLMASRTLWTEGITGELSYLGVTVGSALVAWSSVRRLPKGERTGWSLVALGLVLSALADIAYSVLLVVRDTAPDISIADAFWLGSYIALFAGLLRLLVVRGPDRRIDVDGLIDMCVVAILAVMVLWEHSLRATVFDGTIAPLVRAVWAAYPVLDAVMLGLVVRMLISRPARRATGLVLAAGALCWLVADLSWMLSEAVSGVWADAEWMLGAALIALAARAAGAIGTTEDVAIDRIGRGRVLLAIAPLLVPVLVEAWSYARGYDPNPVPLLIAAVCLGGLAYARAVRLLRAGQDSRDRLAASWRHFRALAANSSDAVVVIDADGTITNDAPQLPAMLGRSDIATVGADLGKLLQPIDTDWAKAALQQISSMRGEVVNTEMRVRHEDGTTMWLAARALNLQDDPDVGGIVINLHDITDRKRAEDELSHQAFHDSLTGLANRALFRDRIEHGLRRAGRSGAEITVASLDLDGFKLVNDNLGHEAGDELLCEVARRLEGAVRSSDTVARLGGDEFAVLVDHSARSVDDAVTIADRILQSLSQPFVVAGQQVRLSASIGIAPADATASASSLLRDADIAMYEAKTTGRNAWVLYDAGMQAAAAEERQLEADLRDALGHDQFRLLYQPVVQLDSGRVTGFEALLRWDHPERGMVLPEDFIRRAEDNGMIVDVGRWVLDEACRTAANWSRQPGAAALTMAVNVSARQIASLDFIDHVRDALEASGFDPASLVLEMTETVLIQDAATAAERLHELRSLGVRIAIDDFGTGYSSLSYLRQFPIDILKIDRSFVSTINDRDQVPPIVRGLLELGRTLQLETIAEGIELDAQRDGLRDEHCLLGQGYLFARPLSSDGALRLLVDGAALDPVAPGT
ncbi:MAG: EAL domain-containing protein [Acidimicrobiia bacterium]